MHKFWILAVAAVWAVSGLFSNSPKAVAAVAPTATVAAPVATPTTAVVSPTVTTTDDLSEKRKRKRKHAKKFGGKVKVARSGGSCPTATLVIRLVTDSKS